MCSLDAIVLRREQVIQKRTVRIHATGSVAEQAAHIGQQTANLRNPAIGIRIAQQGPDHVAVPAGDIRARRPEYLAQKVVDLAISQQVTARPDQRAGQAAVTDKAGKKVVKAIDLAVGDLDTEGVVVPKEPGQNIIHPVERNVPANLRQVIGQIRDNIVTRSDKAVEKAVISRLFRNVLRHVRVSVRNRFRSWLGISSTRARVQHVRCTSLRRGVIRAVAFPGARRDNIIRTVIDDTIIADIGVTAIGSTVSNQAGQAAKEPCAPGQRPQKTTGTRTGLVVIRRRGITVAAICRHSITTGIVLSVVVAIGIRPVAQLGIGRFCAIIAARSQQAAHQAVFAQYAAQQTTGTVTS